MSPDFDRVLALDELSLRALLEGSDARDRLWAVWALALKRGPSALAEHLVEEPSAGVRRHMCIVLAGGELDLLVAMARFDPDDGVRATASGLVARLAGGGRLPWSIALERLDDPASRAAILSELTSAAPPELAAAAIRFASDRDRDVALAAIEALFRIQPASVTPILANALDHASEQEAYGIFSLWSKHSEPDAIHDSLRTASTRARLAAVRHFASRWVDVAAVGLDPDVEVRSAVRDAFLRRLAVVPIDVLAVWSADDDAPFGYFADAILARLERGDALPAGTGFLARCRRRLAMLHASLPPEITEQSLAVLDEDDEDAYDERGCLLRLIATIEGLN